MSPNPPAAIATDQDLHKLLDDFKKKAWEPHRGLNNVIAKDKGKSWRGTDKKPRGQWKNLRIIVRTLALKENTRLDDPARNTSAPTRAPHPSAVICTIRLVVDKP